jgi:hypothetical protein
LLLFLAARKKMSVRTFHGCCVTASSGGVALQAIARLRRQRQWWWLWHGYRDHSTDHRVGELPIELRIDYLVPQFVPKFHYAKRKFPVTSKYRQMHRVLNIDEMKN